MALLRSTLGKCLLESPQPLLKVLDLRLDRFFGHPLDAEPFCVQRENLTVSRGQITQIWVVGNPFFGLPALCCVLEHSPDTETARQVSPPSGS